jgi:hypothetical protein
VLQLKMRVAGSVAVTVLATTLLAGCQFITPQQTARSYNPADGVNGTAGHVEIRNVFVLDGADETASLIGVLSNTSDAANTVTLQWTAAAGTETKRLVIPAGGLLSLSTDPTTVDASVPGATGSVILEGVKATPGALFNMTFTTTDGAKSLRLPVLTGAQQQYATLVPTPTPTPTPTATELTPVPVATDGLAPTPTPTDTLAG